MHSLDFLDALVRYETELWNALDTSLRVDHSLSLARLEALRVLHRRDGTCRVQEIAGDLSITVGAASKLVDRLETDGLARRHSHPRDRRSSLIALTDDGRAIHDQAARSLARYLQAHLSRSFDPEGIHHDHQSAHRRASSAAHHRRARQRMSEIMRAVVVERPGGPDELKPRVQPEADVPIGRSYQLDQILQPRPRGEPRTRTGKAVVLIQRTNP